MSTQHTPGPWHINAHDICAGAVAVAGVYGTTGHDAATSKANAQFIVRACNSHDNLLAALNNAPVPGTMAWMTWYEGERKAAIDKAEERP